MADGQDLTGTPPPDYPVKLGAMLFTLVDPDPGHEVAYNRWYERDHYYGGVLLGAGTAHVYPTLLESIGDVAHPTWRSTSVGLYRLWRAGGYVG